jgi:hypothetical protein
LGKALKTIFLCDYLRQEPLRREIDEGLQVIDLDAIMAGLEVGDGILWGWGLHPQYKTCTRTCTACPSAARNNRDRLGTNGACLHAQHAPEHAPHEKGHLKFIFR